MASTWFHVLHGAISQYMVPQHQNRHNKKHQKSFTVFSSPTNESNKKKTNHFCAHHFCLPSLHFPNPPNGLSGFHQPFFDFETTRTPNRFYCSASGTGCWRFEETCPTPWRFQSRKSSFEGCCGRGAGVEKCGEKPSFLSVYNTVFCWIQVIFLVEMEHDLFRSFFTVNPGFAFKCEKN